MLISRPQGFRSLQFLCLPHIIRGYVCGGKHKNFNDQVPWHQDISKQNSTQILKFALPPFMYILLRGYNLPYRQKYYPENLLAEGLELFACLLPPLLPPSLPYQEQPSPLHPILVSLDLNPNPNTTQTRHGLGCEYDQRVHMCTRAQNVSGQPIIQWCFKTVFVTNLNKEDRLCQSLWYAPTLVYLANPKDCEGQYFKNVEKTTLTSS